MRNTDSSVRCRSPPWTRKACPMATGTRCLTFSLQVRSRSLFSFTIVGYSVHNDCIQLSLELEHLSSDTAILGNPPVPLDSLNKLLDIPLVCHHNGTITFNGVGIASDTHTGIVLNLNWEEVLHFNTVQIRSNSIA